jgi:transposase
MVLHLSLPKHHCTSCNRYFRHRFAGIRPRLRATESYRLDVFEAHDGGITQHKLSMTHRVGSATVERWCQTVSLPGGCVDTLPLLKDGEDVK